MAPSDPERLPRLGQTHSTSRTSNAIVQTSTSGPSIVPSQASNHNVIPSSSRSRDQIPGAELSSHDTELAQKKKPRHRAGKKRRKRRESFAGPPSDVDGTSSDRVAIRPSLLQVPERASQEARESFYRLGRGQRSSATSLESEALLDHRDQNPLQARRQSFQQGQYRGSPNVTRSSSNRQNNSSFHVAQNSAQSRSRLNKLHRISGSEGNDDSDDRTPLLSSSHVRHSEATSRSIGGYGGYSESPAGLRRDPFFSHPRQRSAGSSGSRHKTLDSHDYERAKVQDKVDDYDVNNPPSVPGSPQFGPEMGFNDVMLTDADISLGRSPDNHASRDALIDIEENNDGTSPSTSGHLRRMTLNPVDDVCFPHEDMTEIGDDDDRTENYTRRRRGRAKVWPDLDILEQWSNEEKEQRTIQGIRARKIHEPVLVDGRLRPQKTTWHREVDDVPLRFTYFNEDFEATLHSQSLSELIQEGQSFRELFIPDAPILSDSDSEPDHDDFAPQRGRHGFENGTTQRSAVTSPPARVASRNSATRPASRVSTDQKAPSNENLNLNTGLSSPNHNEASAEKEPRYGSRPIWWLDVLSPTDAEMKILSKAFSIHPLTAEDVMVQEQREKVELFRNYYFVNYRTFEQDTNSEDYMEPINMYVIVFREGIISFHFSQTPHPANVRRRIRQLTDYLILTTDWISYAIIDDITDAYAPLAERIEEEVDDIDESILGMHSAVDVAIKKDKNNANLEYPIEKKKDDGEEENLTIAAGDMLRRVGECRKKVMSLYRLLGNKADVIKGFAKRCNEQWEIAPRSEIGLYLGDIQDHIVTMTGNLTHYENLLSRAHSNYLAQINIRMNERAEKTNDVLNNLTVLGTIVLPMNIITGMWGMNCLVPGQNGDNLWWFWGITAGLLMFGCTCFLIAKRTYKL